MAKKKKQPARGDKTLEANKRARHNYEITDEFEAGIALVGSEVKAMREGKVSLTEAYCQFKGTELFLYQAHVAEYVQAHARNHPPLRPRKLLLHRRELEVLLRGSSRNGMTIVPLELYVKGRTIKLLIGLARGKKLHDKRASIKEKDEKREMQRAMRRDHD